MGFGLGLNFNLFLKKGRLAEENKLTTRGEIGGRYLDCNRSYLTSATLILIQAVSKNKKRENVSGEITSLFLIRPSWTAVALNKTN